jgi:hypothetical protein
VDGSVDAAPTEKTAVRRVDDGIHLLLDDVTHYDLKFHGWCREVS